MKKLLSDKFLFILLASAAIFKLPLLFEGLPAVYNSTEYFMSKLALGMGARFSLDPLIYIYPTLYTYFLLIIYSIFFVTGYAAGLFSHAHDFAMQFLTDPTSIYFTGRLMSACFHLATIVIIYHFVNKFRDRNRAITAALIIGVSLNFFEFSAYVTPESMLLMISALATVYIFQLYANRSPGTYFLSGLLCGLAVAVKYNAGFLFTAVLIIYFQNFKQDKKHIYFAISGLIAGFIVSNPYWILKFDSFLSGFLLVSDQMYSAVSTDRGINYIWEIWALIKSELLIGVLFLVATVWAIITDIKKYLPFLAIILLTLAYVGSWEKKGIDYLFPAFPAWILLTTEFISSIRQKYNLKWVITSVIFIPSVVAMIYYSILVIRADTRELATGWLIENIAQDQVICYDYHHYDLGIFDVDRFISYGAGAGQLPDKVKDRLDQYRNHTGNISMRSIFEQDTLIETKGKNLYDAEQRKYRRKDLNQLQSEGVDYLIVRNDFYNMYRYSDPGRYPAAVQARIGSVNKFYNDLFGQFEPVIIFSSDFWRKGPVIKIYKLAGG